jgi:hypothetical protein
VVLAQACHLVVLFENEREFRVIILMATFRSRVVELVKRFLGPIIPEIAGFRFYVFEFGFS